VDVAAVVAARFTEFAVECELVLVDAQFLWCTDLFEAGQRLMERSAFVEFADAV